MEPKVIKELRKSIGSDIAVKGFFRVQIVDPDGSIVGDSGYKKNRITNDGIRFFLVQLMGASANSSRVTHAALGTGTEPGETSTNLLGEVTSRKSVTFSEIASKTAQYVATFASGDSFIGATVTLANIGLFATVTAGVGTVFAGNTYTGSQVATNQSVNITYQIRFSTSA